jgi:hypothetical protein
MRSCQGSALYDIQHKLDRQLFVWLYSALSEICGRYCINAVGEAVDVHEGNLLKDVVCVV